MKMRQGASPGPNVQPGSCVGEAKGSACRPTRAGRWSRAGPAPAPGGALWRHRAGRLFLHSRVSRRLPLGPGSGCRNGADDDLENEESLRKPSARRDTSKRAWEPRYRCRGLYAGTGTGCFLESHTLAELRYNGPRPSRATLRLPTRVGPDGHKSRTRRLCQRLPVHSAGRRESKAWPSARPNLARRNNSSGVGILVAFSRTVNRALW